jgi:FMN-dependent NADH-azoreductase
VREPTSRTSSPPYLSAALGCIGLNTVHYLRLQATAFIDETRAPEVRRSLIATIEPAAMNTLTSDLFRTEA